MKIDKKLATVNIKGKPYVEVKERILALAENTKYSIETDYQHFEEKRMWVVKAKLTLHDTGEVYNWLAQEIESDDYRQVNSTSALENAETSAVGRACAFAGIWVINWIASADEVKKAVNRWSNFEASPSKPTNETHACKKCWALNENVSLSNGKYWPYFKCSACGWISSANLQWTWTETWTPPF